MRVDLLLELKIEPSGSIFRIQYLSLDQRKDWVVDESILVDKKVIYDPILKNIYTQIIYFGVRNSI